MGEEKKVKSVKRTWKLSASVPLASVEITRALQSFSAVFSSVLEFQNHIQDVPNFGRNMLPITRRAPSSTKISQPFFISSIKKANPPRCFTGHEMHFHTSSDNSFDGYAWTFDFLGKLVNSLIRVLIGVGINVGPYSGQLNCKHKWRVLLGRGMTDDGQYPLLALALCFAGRYCSWETYFYGKNEYIMLFECSVFWNTVQATTLGKDVYLICDIHATSSYLEKRMTVLSWNDAQLKIPLRPA